MVSWIYYNSVKKNIIFQQKEIIKNEADHIVSELRVLHKSSSSELLYPVHDAVKTAIYDLDKKYIFGTLPLSQKLDFDQKNDLLYYVKKIEPYYLGAAYMLIERPLDFTPIIKLQKSILFFMLIALLLFSTLGYFLGKLFVAPMKDSIEKMNYFIQDATHELDTPISTILANIEMIETYGDAKNNKELKRIELASKTLSRIYSDLTYINLNHEQYRQISSLDIGKILKERLEYFSAMMEAKSLIIKEDIESGVILQVDENDISRIIDNLISNAIKYNKIGGTMDVTLSNHSLSIRDSGIGIHKNDLGIILQRFKRANKSEGGFGIGLDIVNQVVIAYDYILEINSEENRGTEVKVIWEK